jgi:hypothetical protein
LLRYLKKHNTHYANITIRLADDVDLPADGSVLERLPHVRCTHGETHADGRDETLPFLDNWNDTNARPVRIRPPTPAGPAWNDVLAERAIVHVTGTFFAQTGCHPSLLDAVHMDVIYSSRSCHHIAIAFPPSHVYAVGTITTEQYYVSPTFSALPLTISQRLGWGENFRPRVRMQPLTVFPHRTDLPPQLSHPA